MQAETDLEIVRSLHPSYTLEGQSLLMQWNRPMQRNPGYSSRNLETHTDGWNLVSKLHWQRIPNPVSGIWIHSLDCLRFPYSIWGKMENKYILTRSWSMIVINFTSKSSVSDHLICLCIKFLLTCAKKRDRTNYSNKVCMFVDTNDIKQS